MKRLVVVLGGLLALPAFAEVAPFFYDGMAEYADVEMDDGVVTDEDEIIVDVDQAAPVIQSRPVAARTNTSTRTASRVVPTSAISGNRTQTQNSRVVASRGTTSRTTTTGASRGTTSRTTSTGASRTVASRAGTTGTGTVSARRGVSGASVARTGTTMTTASNSTVSVAEQNKLYNANRVGVRSSAASRMPTVSAVSISNKTTVANAETIKDATAAMDSLAELTDYCKAQYTACMDNFCNVLDDAQGRCSCSKNIKNYEKTEAALKAANEELQDVAQKIQYIGLTADEITTIFKETEAELTMRSSTDNSQITTSLNKIRDMIVDIKTSSASSSDTSGISLDLSNLLSFDISSSGYDITSLFGGSSNTSSIGNQRGETLFKTATARCKATVLNSCTSQGVDAAVITNAYDLEIDKQCIAYERNLTDSNAQMVATVRNANNVLKKARLMVAANKNQYDMRGCISELDKCMQDEYVCGSDYENCLDPSGKYIVNGALVIGSMPGKPLTSTMGAGIHKNNLYSTWCVDEDCSGTYAWDYESDEKYEGNLGKYIDETVTSAVKSTDRNMSKFLQYKIGYHDDSTNKNYGMCISVLNKCQNLTYNKNGKYNPSNMVISEYLYRTMVQIKAAQDAILSDYAESCITDVTSCLVSNNYPTTPTDSNTTAQNIAINACKAMVTTCMSVNGNITVEPTPREMRDWLKDIYNSTYNNDDTQANASSGGSSSSSGSGGGGSGGGSGTDDSCYAITLDRNGGSGGTATIYSNSNGVYSNSGCTSSLSSVTKPDVVPSGCTAFNGYYSASSGGTQYINTSGAITSSGVSAAKGYSGANTWYAQYNCPATTTITLKNGSRTVDTVIATNGVAMPRTTTTPTQSNAVFTGYYDTQSGGTQYYKEDLASARNWDKTGSTATLYAHFDSCVCDIVNPEQHVASCTANGVESNKCKFTYTCENGYHVSSGSESTTSDNVEGPVGVGVYPLGNSLSCVANSSSTPEEPTPTTYNVTLNLNGGSGCSNTTYTAGTAKTIDCTPSKSGYTFAGWCTSSALTSCANSQTISASATGDKTFWAKWTENTTPSNPNNMSVSECVCTPGAHVKTTGNYTCYATSVNENNQCEYTYQCEDGYHSPETTGDPIGHFTGATGVKTNATPSNACTATLLTITLNPYGGTAGTTTALYAKHDEGVYVDASGTTAITTSYTIGKPSRDGYNFNGYYSAAASGTQYITAEGHITEAGLQAGKAYTNSATWYAQWSSASAGENDITLEWSKGGHATTFPDGPTKCTVGGKFTMPAAVSGGSEYTFKGYKVITAPSPNNTVIYNPGDQVDCSYEKLGRNAGGTATISAVFEGVVHDYVVTLMNGETEVGKLYVTYVMDNDENKFYSDSGHTTQVTKAPVPSADANGRVFTGYWFSSSVKLTESDGTIELGAHPVGRDETWYAQWTANTPTARATITLEGSSVSLYVFSDGVYKDANKQNEINTDDVVISGSQLPSNEGQTFKGYYACGENGTTAYISSDGKITNAGMGLATSLYTNQQWCAKWESVAGTTYTITLDQTDATTTGTTSLHKVYHGEIQYYSTEDGRWKEWTGTLDCGGGYITLPTRTGYTFKGYYSGTGSDATQYISGEGCLTSNGQGRKNVEGNETWYAKWESVAGTTYTITLDQTDATTTGTTSLHKVYHGEIQYYSTEDGRWKEWTGTLDCGGGYITLPTRTGYTFKGYYSGTGSDATQYISGEGCLTSNGQGRKNVEGNETWYAKWE